MDAALVLRYERRFAMLRLRLAGIDTLVLSPLCARCPQGRAGCCAAPPAFAWADLGRVVLLLGAAGRDFLLEELRAGRLFPSPRGLSMRRVPAEGDFPARCVYLGETGCVLSPERRSSTCNYYLCDDAVVLAQSEGDSRAIAAQNANENLAEILGRMDMELSSLVRELYPNGVVFDAAFLDWLAEQTAALLRKQKRSLSAARLSRINQA